MDWKPRYPEVQVRLVGEDGNAFAIIARVSTALRRGGHSRETIDEFVREATSGDYDTVLGTCMLWVSCDTDADDQSDDDNSSRRCGWCDELHEECECVDDSTDLLNVDL